MKSANRKAMFAKRKLYRYKPEAQNTIGKWIEFGSGETYVDDRWSGFGGGVSYGERKHAEKFIAKKKKDFKKKYGEKINYKFRIKKIDVSV